MKMPYNAQEEEQLLNQFLLGDRKAFDLLFESVYPAIRRIAKSLSCSAYMTDELLQAGRIGLYEAVHRFQPERGVRLLTYAWPWVLGEMKRALRTGCSLRATLSLESGCDSSGRPLEEVISSEKEIDLQKIDLRAAIKKLCEQEQMLICLRYYRDKSQAETALLLRISQPQVSKLERKALNRLGALLS